MRFDLVNNRNGILISSSDLSSKKTLRMIQSGYSEKGYGINYTTTSVTSGADVIMTQSGIAKNYGIVAGGLSTVTAAAAVTLTQSGYAGVDGIFISGKLSAGSDLSLLQTGSATTTGVGFGGITFSPNNVTDTYRVDLSAPNGWVTMKTNNTRIILAGTDFNTYITGGRVRIDTGTSVLNSQAGNSTLLALGLEVYYTGNTANLPNNTATIAVGSGSFTFVGNGGSGNGTLTNSTTLTYLGLEGVNFGGSAGGRTLGDLTITGSNDSALTGKGVRFGGTVTINGVTSGSEVGGLRLIEGAGISVVTNPSTFSGKLTLVGNGAGDSGWNRQVNSRQSANLTTGTNRRRRQRPDPDPDRQRNRQLSDFEIIKAATLTAGGNLTVIANNHCLTGLSYAATSTAVGMGVSLASGTNNWVKLQPWQPGLKLCSTQTTSR